MTNKEAMKIVLEAAGERADYLANVEPLTKDFGRAEKVQSAVWQIYDCTNDCGIDLMQ